MHAHNYSFGRERSNKGADHRTFLHRGVKALDNDENRVEPEVSFAMPLHGKADTCYTANKHRLARMMNIQ